MSSAFRVDSIVKQQWSGLSPNYIVTYKGDDSPYASIENIEELQFAIEDPVYVRNRKIRRQSRNFQDSELSSYIGSGEMKVYGVREIPMGPKLLAIGGKLWFTTDEILVHRFEKDDEDVVKYEEEERKRKNSVLDAEGENGGELEMEVDNGSVFGIDPFEDSDEIEDVEQIKSNETPLTIEAPKPSEPEPNPYPFEITDNCFYCYDKFDSIADTTEHLETCMTKRGSYYCCVCFREFRFSSGRNKHRNLHTASDHHMCNYCFKGFKSLDSLTVHQERLHKDVTNGYFCFKCDFTCDTRQQLFDHIILAEKDCRNQIQCDLCPEQFGTSKGLKTHLRKIHGKINTPSCGKCLKVFKSDASLQTHLNSKYACGWTKEDCICPVCKKAFRSPSVLAHHVPTHTGEKNWQCTQCDKKVRTKYSLRCHIENVHGPKLECKYCGKMYQKCNIDRHACTGNAKMLEYCRAQDMVSRACKKRFKAKGVTSFPCLVCKFPFKKRKELELHQGAIARGDEDGYKCCSCGELFAEKDVFQKHLMSHSEV